MTPPIVQAPSLAGSGPSRRRYGASRAFTARTVTPGCTRTRAPSSSTSTPLNPVRVSTSTASLSACPDSDVPPPRTVLQSELAPPQLLGDPLRLADREGHDGERRVGGGAGRHDRAVADEEPRHVVRLAPLVD